jgi:dephospho-CoA kinase
VTSPLATATANGAAPAIPRIGLAGGIGSGKSAVARAFAALGCVVSDSDAAAKSLLREPAVRDELVAWWGRGVLTDAGEIDRAKVAGVVFADAAQRARLEGLIHPMLRAGRVAALMAATQAGAPAFVIDAPLLFEAGLEGECDAVVFVEAPREERVRRVRATRGWSEAELDLREAAQWPLDDKRRRCAYRVDNGGDAAKLDGQVRTILDAVRARNVPKAEGQRGGTTP